MSAPLAWSKAQLRRSFPSGFLGEIATQFFVTTGTIQGKLLTNALRLLALYLDVGDVGLVEGPVEVVPVPVLVVPLRQHLVWAVAFRYPSGFNSGFGFRVSGFELRVEG